MGQLAETKCEGYRIVDCTLCSFSTPAIGCTQIIEAPDDAVVGVGAIVCFPCLFMATLKGCTCVHCDSVECVGFVVTEMQGRVAPVPVCNECFTVADPGEIIVDSRTRRIVPDGGTQ